MDYQNINKYLSSLDIDSSNNINSNQMLRNLELLNNPTQMTNNNSNMVNPGMNGGMNPGMNVNLERSSIPATTKKPNINELLSNRQMIPTTTSYPVHGNKAPILDRFSVNSRAENYEN